MIFYKFLASTVFCYNIGQNYHKLALESENSDSFFGFSVSSRINVKGLKIKKYYFL